MPKPTAPDLELLDLMSDSAYWEAWDARLDVALESLLTFHGACDSNVAATAASTAASIADAAMQERLLRVQAIEDARLAAKEAEAEEKAVKPKRIGGSR